jgi:hypothetical protein
MSAQERIPTFNIGSMERNAFDSVDGVLQAGNYSVNRGTAVLKLRTLISAARAFDPVLSSLSVDSEYFNAVKIPINTLTSATVRLKQSFLSRSFYEVRGAEGLKTNNAFKSYDGTRTDKTEVERCTPTPRTYFRNYLMLFCIWYWL